MQGNEITGASRQSVACQVAAVRRARRFQRFRLSSRYPWRSSHPGHQLREFKRQIARLVRACGVPVGMVEGRSAEGIGPDLVVVDIRSDASSGMAAIERLRASSAALAIFAVAAAAEPDLILQAMRAGANEFFPWTAAEGSQAARATEESFHGAVRRPRRGAKPRRRAPSALCHSRVSWSERRRWHDDRRGETAASSWPSHETPTVVVDLKACSARSRVFLGVRPLFTCLTRSKTCTAWTRTS